MTGTGTSSDPYVPTTWNEFVTAIGTEGAWVSLPANTVWDMNQIEPEGFTSAITVRASSIKGNGAKIKNLYFKQNGCFSLYGSSNTNYHTFSGFEFSNVLIEDGGCFVYSPHLTNWQYFTFSQCKISAKVVDGYFAKFDYGQSAEIQIHQSSINVEFTGNSSLVYYKPDSSNWGLRLDFVYANLFITGKMPADPGYGLRNSNIALICAQKSVISGNWDTTGATRNIYITTDSGSYSTSQYSIFDIDIPATSTLETYGTSRCLVINSDRIESGATIGSSLTQLTETQIHDAAYLNSLGLPIGVD